MSFGRNDTFGDGDWKVASQQRTIFSTGAHCCAAVRGASASGWLYVRL
jgi:hypothetical protein